MLQCVFRASEWVLANRASSWVDVLQRYCICSASVKRNSWLRLYFFSVRHMRSGCGLKVYSLAFTKVLITIVTLKNTLSQFSLQLIVSIIQSFTVGTTAALSLSERWHDYIWLRSGTIYHYEHLCYISSVSTDARTQEISFVFCDLLNKTTHTVKTRCLECCGRVGFPAPVLAASTHLITSLCKLIACLSAPTEWSARRVK